MDRGATALSGWPAALSPPFQAARSGQVPSEIHGCVENSCGCEPVGSRVDLDDQVGRSHSRDTEGAFEGPGAIGPGGDALRPHPGGCAGQHRVPRRSMESRRRSMRSILRSTLGEVRPGKPQAPTRVFSTDASVSNVSSNPLGAEPSIATDGEGQVLAHAGRTRVPTQRPIPTNDQHRVSGRERRETVRYQAAFVPTLPSWLAGLPSTSTSRASAKRITSVPYTRPGDAPESGPLKQRLGDLRASPRSRSDRLRVKTTPACHTHRPMDFTLLAWRESVPRGAERCLSEGILVAVGGRWRSFPLVSPAVVFTRCRSLRDLGEARRSRRRVRVWRPCAIPVTRTASQCLTGGFGTSLSPQLFDRHRQRRLNSQIMSRPVWDGPGALCSESTHAGHVCKRYNPPVCPSSDRLGMMIRLIPGISP
jgi:hypothetical protein